jgi:HK97 family phage portal protein
MSELTLSRWSRLWRWLGGEISNPDKGAQRSGPLSRASDTGEFVSEERALQVTAVWAALRILSGIVASLPIQVLVKQGDKWIEDENHYLLNALEYAPNPIMTGFDMRRALAMQLAFYGNAYAQIIREGSGQAGKPGKVREIFPLKPSQMLLKRIDADTIAYEYTVDGNVAVLALSSVLHVRGMSLDGLIGFNPIAYGAQAIGIGVAAERMASDYYKKGGRPSGVLMVDAALTEPQRAKIKENYKGLVADGPENSSDGSNGLWVLPAFAKYSAISANADEAQLLPTRAFQVAEYARLFGVPSILLMDHEKTTSWGSGVEQQILAFNTFSITPNALQPFAAAFNRWLLSPEEQRTTRIRFDVEELLAADMAAKSAFIEKMVLNGVITRDEARMMLGYNGRGGVADQLTAQQQNVPIDILGAAQPAGGGNVL